MKYKNVPVSGMTIWQLGQATSESDKFYDADGGKIRIKDHAIQSPGYGQIRLANQLKEGKITTLEPVEWWEDLPKLVRYRNNGKIYLAVSLDEARLKLNNDGFIDMDYCTPLTAEEASEFGV